MNTAPKNIDLPAAIFDTTAGSFAAMALAVFRFQHANNAVYRSYCDMLHINVENIHSIEHIPFLPIVFFKTHTIGTTDFEPAVVFESSGTTQTINSRHLVKDTSLYEKSFTTGFEMFYGDPKDWCIIALLPSYLERNNSSLVWMADKLIRQTNHSKSGFYLHDTDALVETLAILEQQQQKTLLIGVTFALLDLAEKHSFPLRHTTIIETGGMKGRREELTRQEVHEALMKVFSITAVHSEYGMTELLSQAWSAGNGIFNCPPWMKVLIREEDDPLTVHAADPGVTISGAVNIIDLANYYSCSFIATDDACKLYPNGSFEILGRLDNSDIRGCSLLSL